MTPKDAIICLDIGGTNCRIGLVTEAMELCRRDNYSTAELSEKGFARELVRRLRAYIAEAEGYRIRAVALGVPATVDLDRRIVLQASNIEGLEDLAICDLLEKELGLPAYLEKDVNLLLLYDIESLKPQSRDILIGIYFGTGIGNSIYVHGRLLAGKNGVSGELGHVPQMHAHTKCGCGNENCLETLGGGKRLADLAETVFTDTPIRELYLRHADHPLIREQVEAMAIAVATEVNILDPSCVILGGGLLQMPGFPKDFFEEKIKAYTRKPYPAENLSLLYSRPDQDNGILGAGYYGWKCFKEASH